MSFKSMKLGAIVSCLPWKAKMMTPDSLPTMRRSYDFMTEVAKNK